MALTQAINVFFYVKPNSYGKKTIKNDL
jgi:hypothetical protein